MNGLTVRWSLMGAPAGTEDALRAYVREESAQRFTGMPGLHQKVWQLAPGGFFAGVYVWETAEAREAFLERFRASPSKVSQIVGSEPEAVQTWEVVASVLGEAGPLVS